jgi:thioester reductase-like protein
MYTLLTGATGLVGRYLVRDFLLNGHLLAVVVRKSRRQDAHQRMEEVLQHWERELGRPLPRPVVLAGDISETGFALSATDRQWVNDHCDKIIHSAAILEFYGEDRAGEPWRTNLGGTRNMIQLCRDLDIRDIHYVSTAYVAGLQEDVVKETSLAAGQEFRNDYEHSKFLAESEVRAIDFADHVTVYRPAVISGDSRTGYTNTYHGIYLYLRLMALMIPALPPGPDGVRFTPIRLRMDGTERRNIIPVEWVSAVMTRLFETPEARDLTFHMAPDVPLTSRELIDFSGEYFNSTGAELCGDDYDKLPPVSRDDNEDQWMFERLITENMTTYAPYERTDNTFDMTNTKRFAGDIHCPEIDRTVIRRYIEYGNEDKWGKRRSDVQDPAFHAKEFFANQAVTECDDNTLTVGVDLSGPGGAQFTITMSKVGVHGIERGLPSDEHDILRTTAEEFSHAIDERTTVTLSDSDWDLTDDRMASHLTEMLLAVLAPASTRATV